MKKLKRVLVGKGMAGVRTLEERLKIAPDLHDITVFGTERHPNCNRILPSPVLAVEQTIDPFILPVPGNDQDGVIAYRDIADTQAMIDAAKTHPHAVVIGGGLLGLEADNGLMPRDMQVTVVHVMDTLMERQLDDSGGQMLQQSLVERGLRFEMGAHTAALLGKEASRVQAVQFKDDREITADLMVMFTLEEVRKHTKAGHRPAAARGRPGRSRPAGRAESAGPP